ncbi:MAG: hypothetical protein K1X74_13825 [Pirellulales bacterium]|nr:hypothetical protein [Pirellulales bacterium]
MMRSFGPLLLIANCLVVCAAAQTAEPESRKAVHSALASQESWLGQGANADRWREFLDTAELQRQVAQGAAADPVVLSQILGKYSAGLSGLENPRFAAVRRALAAWLDTFPRIELGQLAERFASAEDQFVPTTEADVERARKALADAATRLDAYLSPGGENGSKWKDYLEWHALEEQIAAGAKADPAVLARLLRNYRNGYVGLEMRVFSDVAAALETYSDRVQSARVADAQAEYAQARKVIGDRLRKYLESPSGEGYEDLSEVVGFFERRRHARGLLSEIRRHFGHANLFVRVSERIVSAAMAEPVYEVTPLNDSILGTSIHGTGVTTGAVRIDLVPSDQYAVFDAVFEGQTRSRTVGVNGPAIIHTAACTNFSALQPIYLDAGGLATLSADAHAQTNSTTLGIGSTKGRLVGGIVRRVATKRVAKSKGEAEWIGARHAEKLLIPRLEERVAESILKANQTYRERFRYALARRHALPAVLDFRSSHNALLIDWLQQGPGWLGAPSRGPALRRDADISVRLHETMINNLTQSALAGVRLDEAEMQRLTKEIYGEVPRQFASSEGEQPWSITFARRRPITVRFDDDHVTITIRGSRYTSGETAYQAMNVTTVYRVERTGDQVSLVRQGEIDVLPPDFKPGDKLSLKETSLRQLLIRRFGKIFEDRYDLAQVPMTGRLADAGELAVLEFSPQDGWMATSWLLVPKGSGKAPAPAAAASPFTGVIGLALGLPR